MGKKMSRCVIIGSAPVEQAGALKKYLREGDTILCADGGLDTAARMGVIPQLVAGDFDSCIGKPSKEIPVIRLPVKKDDTDLMFCVKEGLRRGFDDFLILGATGGRLDHTYGNLGVLLYLANRGAKNLLADPQNQAFVAISGTWEIKADQGTAVSVFPYGCSKCCVSYQGLAYPLDHGVLSAEEPVGVSNLVIHDTAKIEVHQGPVLVILSQLS